MTDHVSVTHNTPKKLLKEGISIQALKANFGGPGNVWDKIA